MAHERLFASCIKKIHERGNTLYTIEDSLKEHGERFDDLKDNIEEYQKAKPKILTGYDRKEKTDKLKKAIMEELGATTDDWDDYKWQMKNRISDPELISKLLGLDTKEKEKISKVAERFRFAVSPYYLTLIDKENTSHCPIYKQAIPCDAELAMTGELDPMDEEGTSVGELITRRYPDRLIIKVTNVCGMFCRFCQRRRAIGESDLAAPKKQIEESIEYVRQNPEIRDVLITGGDSFLIPDATIDWMLKKLREIDHVEIIRFGTRTPVTLPQRITKKLVSILKKYAPVYVNTHFNSVREFTKESKKACAMLADAGIPLGNQMVLLNGVNNNKFVVRKINQELLKMRVRPYYIFHPKDVRGTKHFYCKVEEGLDIMESLRGKTSGMAIPTYIVNGPGGLGKTPVMPSYLFFVGKNRAVFRNWEGKSFEIRN